MPSRKKAQGKVRKQKRLDLRSNPLNNDAGTPCKHYIRRRVKKWPRGEVDVDALNNLGRNYLSRYRGSSLRQAHGDLDGFHHEVYNEYCQFNDSLKKIFKEMMIAKGTTACIAAAKQTDLPFLSGTLPYICFILAIEVRDRYDEVMNHRVAAGEVRKCLDDITHCPCEIVRFFHRRNPCGCLKELYYNLKDTTKRTAACYNCMNNVEIRKLSRCQHCKVAQYCSYECAVAHWQEHKEECKQWRHCSNITKAEL